MLAGMKRLSATELESVLKACPILECLDASWIDTSRSSSVDIAWAALGIALTRYGFKLRKIRLDDSGVRPQSTEQSDLINLASLTHLQSLSLPLEVVLSEPAGQHKVPTTEAEQDCQSDTSDAEESDDGECLED
jgi:hypothetical protein